MGGRLYSFCRFALEYGAMNPRMLRGRTDPPPAINWGDYDHFSKSEFDCRETGENAMRPAFVDKLQALRYEYGRPMIITSGYRSPRHSIESAKPDRKSTRLNSSHVAISYA